MLFETSQGYQEEVGKPRFYNTENFKEKPLPFSSYAN